MALGTQLGGDGQSGLGFTTPSGLVDNAKTGTTLDNNGRSGTVYTTPDGLVADSSQSRLSTIQPATPTIPSSPTVTMNGTTINDNRVRISMLPNSPNIFYKDSTNALLSILQTTNGVLFPFQPKVDMTFSSSYQAQKVVQSNFTFYSYENSEIAPFDITCDFPAKTIWEGQYVIAVKTFLRSLTMMFTGNDTFNGTNLAGSPPLVVSIYGMGFGGLDTLPCVVTKVTDNYPDNIDYISIPIPSLNNEITKVPVLTTLTVSITPMFSRDFASSFSTLRFSSGNLRLLGPKPIISTPAVAPTVDPTNVGNPGHSLAYHSPFQT